MKSFFIGFVFAAFFGSFGSALIEQPPSIDKKWCPDNSFFEFVPVHIATLSPTTPTASWTTDCFTSNTASFLEIDEKKKSATISIHAQHSTSWLCEDAYLVASRRNFVDKIKFFRGTSKVTLTADTDADFEWMKKNGVMLFAWPCGIEGTAKSLLLTAELFAGPVKNQEKRVKEFVLDKLGFSLVDFNKEQKLDKSLIKSGDQLHIRSFSGTDALVEFGTGSRTGHTAVFLWRDGILFVVESTGEEPNGNEGDWPPPYGVIMTEFDKWIVLARAAKMDIVIAPLSEELSAKFDVHAAWRWFDDVQGNPYGYPNFLYTFMDAYPPGTNYPQPIDESLLRLFVNQYDELLEWADRIFHGALSKLIPDTFTVEMFFIHGLNHRLNSNCTDMICVNERFDEMDMSIGTAFAMPEKDWNYKETKGGRSMVCSVLVAEILKAGLKNEIPFFYGGEQSPMDVYQMKAFDPQRFNEENCPVGLHTSEHGGTYCQIIGQFWLELNGYNTIDLYDDMNEHCSPQWPDFKRCSAQGACAC